MSPTSFFKVFGTALNGYDVFCLQLYIRLKSRNSSIMKLVITSYEWLVPPQVSPYEMEGLLLFSP